MTSKIHKGLYLIDTIKKYKHGGFYLVKLRFWLRRKFFGRGVGGRGSHELGRSGGGRNRTCILQLSVLVKVGAELVMGPD